MSIQEYGGLVAVLAATFVMRLVPGTLWRPLDFDTGTHLLFRAAIRRNRMRMPAKCDSFTLDERQTYPWLYHQLIALLPERALRRFPALPSAIVDAFHAAIVFGLTATLARDASPGHSVADATVAGLLFATSPALLAHGVGPRAYEVTPRPFGELLFTLTLVLFAYGSIAGSAIAISGAAVVCGLCFLASRFCVQTMLFTFPLVAVWTGRYALLALIPAGAATALLLSKGRYRWIALAQVRHLVLYRRRLQYDHPAVAARNRWSDLRTAAVRAARSRLRDRRALKDLASALEHNTYVQFTIRDVIWWLILLVWASGSFPLLTAEHSWRTFLLVWTLSPLIPALLTSLRSWRFLGEAERYPEYATAPACVLAGLAVPSYGWITVLGFTASIPVLAYAWHRQRTASRRPWMDALPGVVDAMRRIPADATILAIPVNLAPTLAHETERRFAATTDGIVFAANYEQIFTQYPWPSPSFDWWKHAHGVDHLVVMRRLLEDTGRKTEYEFETLPVVFDNSDFVVYRLP
jgi:hypothetical protein